MNNIAISINCFRSGGGMESYTFDLVRQLTAEQQTVSVYASVFDTTVPEYRQIQAVHINQKRIPKKLRPYFFRPPARPQTPAWRATDCLQPQRPCRCV